MRPSLLLLVVLGGCASVAGIDDWPSGTNTTSTGVGVGGETGTGASASGGADAGGGGASAQGGSGGNAGSGGACDSLKCYYGQPATSAAASCDETAASGSCVPEGWSYCDCAGNTPAVFLELDQEGHPSAVTLIANEDNQPFALGVNSGCAGQTATNCPAYCANGLHLYRWTDFGGVPVDKITSFHVWMDDTGDVCWDADGGSVMMDIGL